MICTLRSHEPRIFGFIKAIIDTGSPFTILGGEDVNKMRLSQVQMKKLAGEEKEANLGGAQMKTRVLPEAEIRVSGSVIKIPVQVPVKILAGTPPPTILGVDFLLKGKFKFYFDPNNKEAYLETQK